MLSPGGPQGHPAFEIFTVSTSWRGGAQRHQGQSLPWGRGIPGMVDVLLLYLRAVVDFSALNFVLCRPWAAPRMPWDRCCAKNYFASGPWGDPCWKKQGALSGTNFNPMKFGGLMPQTTCFCALPQAEKQVNMFKIHSPEAFPENCSPCLCLKNSLMLHWSICRKQTGPLEHLQRTNPNKMRLLSICACLNYWISPSHGSGLNMYK